MDPTEQRPDKAANEALRKAGPQIISAVFLSFLSVRKNKKWQEDAASITPLQAVIGELIGALSVIVVLIFNVRMVTRRGLDKRGGTAAVLSRLGLGFAT